MNQRTPLVLLATATAVAVSACNSDPAPFDTSAFADEIADTLDDELSDDEFSAEVRCPIDDWEEIVEASMQELDDDVVRDALRTDTNESAFATDAGSYLDCSFFDDEIQLGAGVFLLEAPRDPEDYAEEFAGEGARVDVEETDAYRGGQFRHVCVEYDDGEPYCQVEWSDENVLIGVYVVGEDADRIDTDVLEDGFRPRLDLVMAQFEA
ncbi:MAG: hypothetical protein ABJH68_16160 [Ilumatobacter sp.]|uniref:hypothetical protein n=1 Tax=Ilumatobacter sp. TaxID=1967498 RepID=UPI003299D538